MKKTITFAIMALIALTGNAQLKVDSLGRTGMGLYDSVLYDFSHPGYYNNYRTHIYSSASGSLCLQNDSVGDSKYAMTNLSSSLTTSYPYSSVGISSTIANKSGVTCWFLTGTKSIASGGYNSYGVHGGLSKTSSISGGAGIIGTTTASILSFTGIYAGYFAGDVKATGTIYGTLLSPSSAASSPNGGSASATVVRSDENSITNKLQQVDLLQMERVNQDGSLAANKVVEKESVRTMAADGAASADGIPAEMKEEVEDPIQTRLSSVSYGLAADQLKEVYPELVYEDEQGNYSINYIEMVPLLVQSIKELSSEVTALKQQLGTQESVKKGKKQVSSIEDADMEVVSMSQNRPNPFKDKSVIALNIPSDTKQAVINIYDMSGKQVQTIPVSERGKTNITVYARHLQPGMFIYSLLVDGKVQATRKMMVTE